MREQRLVFGEVAELYDRARAGYPAALVDDVLGFAQGDGPGLRALEGGAGTGKATAAFGARGLDILALEPSPAMAEVARRNCRAFPGVRVTEASFEDWPGPPGGFGLVYSASAWHWVDPAVRNRKAAEVLSPGGTLALFWHRVRWQDEPLRDELDRLYRRLVPGLYAQGPGFPGLSTRRGEGSAGDEIGASGWFADVTERLYPWSATFTADSFAELLMTQSDHRLLPEDQRTELLDGVREIIARHGGEVEIPHATRLLLARNRPALAL